MISGFLFSSGSGEIEHIISGNPDSENKILILVEISDYRFALVESIKNKLSVNGDVFITIDDLGSFEEYTLDTFTALVVLNAGKMMSVDDKVKKIIELSEKKNIIVMTTWGGKGSNQDIGVDSITAASSKENIEDMTDKVLTLLEKYGI